MTDPNLITALILLPLAFIAHAHRHRNDPPFAEQWYRGCGRNPSNVRGSVHSVTGATKHAGS